MSYYKILTNGVVTDANDVFLRWQERHRCLLACAPEEGQFISSSDGGAIYRAEWLNHAPVDVAELYPMAEAVEIGETEYLELRDALEAGEQPAGSTEPEPEMAEEPSNETGCQTERPMTRAELTAQVEQLRAQVEQLAETNELLIGAVMEMSEIAYA